MFSELEKLKEEAKILKEIEKYQKGKKAKKTEYNVLNTRLSNLTKINSDHDHLLKTERDEINPNGYTRINTNTGTFYGNLFCFP